MLVPHSISKNILRLSLYSWCTTAYWTLLLWYIATETEKDLSINWITVLWNLNSKKMRVFENEHCLITIIVLLFYLTLVFYFFYFLTSYCSGTTVITYFPQGLIQYSESESIYRNKHNSNQSSGSLLTDILQKHSRVDWVNRTLLRQYMWTM